jgi:hypothetical protein
MLGRRVWHVVLRLRFVWLQACILAATAWVLWPLRDASRLPNPSWPQYTPDPPDLQASISLGPTMLAPGTQGATRVIVYDPRSGHPLPDAQVQIALAPAAGRDGGGPDNVRHPLYEGRTGSQGTVAASFDVPLLEHIEWDLVIDVAGPVGRQRIVHPVAIRRETQIELSTDHLVYRPGETLHLWLRTLDGASALPLAGRPVTTTVYDARDTLICQDGTVTSAYGVATSGCPLADGAGRGTYRVMALIGDGDFPDHLAQRQVEVKAPVESRLYVQIESDETYALAGRPLTGIVRAAYWWGRPLAGAQVALTAELEGEPRLLLPVGQEQGETDANGVWRFALDLDPLPGNDLRRIAPVGPGDRCTGAHARGRDLAASSQPGAADPD